MSLNDYRFDSLWRMRAPADAVFDVVVDLESYPRWWPQIRQVEPIDNDHARMAARSLLPYDLHFMLVRSREDRDAGVLEARLEGDLEGWARWNLTGTTYGCVLHYEQQVTVRRSLLRRTAWLCRPLFRYNHTIMMRSGERGLAKVTA